MVHHVHMIVLINVLMEFVDRLDAIMSYRQMQRWINVVFVWVIMIHALIFMEVLQVDKLKRAKIIIVAHRTIILLHEFQEVILFYFIQRLKVLEELLSFLVIENGSKTNIRLVLGYSPQH